MKMSYENVSSDQMFALIRESATIGRFETLHPTFSAVSIPDNATFVFMAVGLLGLAVYQWRQQRRVNMFS